MASLNKVMLIGNLTRDPEVRYTPKGTAVAELGLAVNRVFNSDNGERREEVTFIDVTVWGRGAEIAGEYMKKGRQIFVEGRLQMDTWDDKATGQKRSKIKVVAENTILLGSRGQGGGGSGEEGGGAPPPARSYGGGGSGSGSGGYSGGGQRSGQGSNAGPSKTAQPPKDPDLDPDQEDDIPF